MNANRSSALIHARQARALATTCAGAVILILALLALSQGAVPAHARAADASLPAPAGARAAGIDASDVFTYAIGGDAVGLDPSRVTDGSSFLVARQIYENLVHYEPGGTVPVPGLAERWTVSPDGLTWTFELRPGVRFQDGTSLDAAAVVYNFQRWWDPAHPFHDGPFEFFQYMFRGFKGDPGCLLSDVQAIGTDQVQLVLSEPHSPLPNTLAMPAFAIASPAAIQAGTLATQPVGSGPFAFVAWQPGDQIRLAGNPDYRGPGPYLQTLVFQVIPDSADRLATLQADAVQGTDNLAWTDVATATLDPNLKVAWRPAPSTGYLGINRAHGPLDDPLVNQAIAHALDKASIVDSHYNALVPRGQVATQLLPPAVWGRDDDLVDYAYDPPQAQALLAQAGYTNGFTTTLWVMPVERWYLPNPTDIAQSMQADLQAVGISTTLVTEYDWPTYLNKVSNGEADLFMLGWGSDNGHPDNFFYPLLCDNYLKHGPRDDVLCNHLEAARQVHDFNTLVTMYEWASQRVHDTLPLVPVGHSRTAPVLRQNVGGFVPAPVGMESFGEVFLADQSVQVSPGASATLVYTDPLGSPTCIDVPAGAVSETVTLLFAPIDAAAGAPGFFAGHAFVLEAHRDGALLPGFTFQIPVSITIHYVESDVIGLREDTLALHYWDGEAWSADGITVVERDPVANRLMATVDHLSAFGTFARGAYGVYLPVISKAQP